MDFQIYTRGDQPTGQFVSDAVRSRILLSIPDLYSVHILDGPYRCRPGAFYNWSPPSEPGRCWYVHYITEARIGWIGAGLVMVIDSATAQILYDGTDGGE